MWINFIRDNVDEESLVVLSLEGRSFWLLAKRFMDAFDEIT
jgi:hypothetical protein